MRTLQQAVTTIVQLGAVVALSITTHAAAQQYPTKPVRIVAPNSNTTAHNLARFVGTKLSEQWKQGVVVDPRSGAPAAMMPAITVARANPDGYTLLMGETGSLAAAVSLFSKLEYKPKSDFVPITLVARAPLVLLVNASTPVSDLRQFITFAKENQRALSYASAAVGTVSHLTTALFLQLTGIEAVHVPYRGGSAATLAVVAGEVPFASITVSSAIGHINAGKVRALAVSSKQRFPPIANVPTAADAGLGGFEAEAWYGLLAPARTPANLVTRLHRDVTSVLKDPAMQALFITQGAEPLSSTPEEFKQFIEDETAKWRRVINAAGIRLD